MVPPDLYESRPPAPIVAASICDMTTPLSLTNVRRNGDGDTFHVRPAASAMPIDSGSDSVITDKMRPNALNQACIGLKLDCFMRIPPNRAFIARRVRGLRPAL